MTVDQLTKCGRFRKTKDDSGQAFPLLYEHVKRCHEVARATQAIIRNNDGYRCQFHVDDKGTILIVAFGVYPFSHEDDAFRCVKASIEMRAALMRLECDHTIGVATGDIYVGAVGSTQRTQYTVMGDTVNLSARLAGKCVTNSILVEKTTVNMVRGKMQFRDDGEIAVKGKSTAINIFTPFEVLDVKKKKLPHLMSSPANALGGTKVGETVSRAEETKEILDCIVSLQSGEGGRVILVEGASGMGKTVLLRNMYRICHLQQSVLLTVCANTKISSSSSPFALWRNVIEQIVSFAMRKSDDGNTIMGDEMTLPVAECLTDDKKLTRAMESFLQVVFGNTDARAPLINFVMQSSLPPNDLVNYLNSNAEERTDQIINFIADLFEGMASKRCLGSGGLSGGVTKPKVRSKRSSLTDFTMHKISDFFKNDKEKVEVKLSDALGKRSGLVIMLEDVHDLSAPALRVLLELAKKIENLPVILVASARTDREDENKEWRGVREELVNLDWATVISPSGLERKPLERLLCQHLGVNSLPASVVELVYSRSEGNPLYAIEMAMRLVDDEVIREENHECVIIDEAKLEKPDIPQSLKALVNQRIDKLPVNEGYLCKLASVFNAPFTAKMLTAVFVKTKSSKQSQQSPEITLRRLVTCNILEVTEVLDMTKKDKEKQKRQLHSFKNSILKNACYSRLLYSQRSTIHCVIASVLKQTAKKGDKNELDSLLTHHYTLALESAAPTSDKPEDQNDSDDYLKEAKQYLDSKKKKK